MTNLTTTYSQKYKHLADLAQSYTQAGKYNQAARFYRLAGDKAAADFANDDALDYYTQALTLTADTNAHERFRILLAREQLFNLIGEVDGQQRDLKSLEALANYLNSDGMRAEVAIRQANYHENKGAYDTALTLARLASRLAHHIKALVIEAEAALTIGKVHTRQGNYEAAQVHLEEALALAQQCGARLLQAHVLRACGILANQQKRFAAATQHYDQALALYAEQGDKLGRTHVLSNLGHVEQMQGHLTAALTYWEQARDLFQELGDREGKARVLVNLSTISVDTGRYQHAKQYNEEALQVCRDIKLLLGQCFSLLNLGLIAHYQNDNSQALTYLREALQIAQNMGSKQLQGHILNNLGHALTALGEFAEAEVLYWEAIGLWDEFQLSNLVAEAMAGLARAKLAEQKLEAALTLAEEILLMVKEDPQLDGAEGPVRIYITCYEVLQANGDKRAADVLHQGYQQLQRLLNEVADGDLKESMRQNIAAHKAVITAVQNP